MTLTITVTAEGYEPWTKTREVRPQAITELAGAPDEDIAASMLEALETAIGQAIQAGKMPDDKNVTASLMWEGKEHTTTVEQWPDEEEEVPGPRYVDFGSADGRTVLYDLETGGEVDLRCCHQGDGRRHGAGAHRADRRTAGGVGRGRDRHGPGSGNLERAFRRAGRAEDAVAVRGGVGYPGVS